MRVPASIRRFASEDVNEVVKKINALYKGYEMIIESIEYTVDSASEDPNSFTVYVDTTFRWNGDNAATNSLLETSITFEYVVDGENVYTGGDIDEWVESVEDRLTLDHPDTHVVNQRSADVKSSTSVRGKRRIVAADEDEELGGEEFIDDEMYDDDEGLGDTLDNMADQLDDIQDQVEDIEEDSIDIEIDNNIVNHYIAECEGCHGVFISAMIESDQHVDHISGTCPLCEKETDQYLKWVIKPVEG